PYTTLFRTPEGDPRPLRPLNHRGPSSRPHRGVPPTNRIRMSRKPRWRAPRNPHHVVGVRKWHEPHSDRGKKDAGEPHSHSPCERRLEFPAPWVREVNPQRPARRTVHRPPS